MNTQKPILNCLTGDRDDLIRRLREKPYSFEQSEFERLIELYQSRLGFDEVMSIIAKRIRHRKNADQLESNALLAILEDRSDEFERLLNVLDRRNRLGFSLVSHEPESPPQSS